MLQRRKRHVDDRQIERGHERAEGGDREHEAAPAPEAVFLDGFSHGSDPTALHSIMQLTYHGRVERKSFAGMDCSVAQCLEVVGEWWSMLIMRDCFLGVTRFDDFQRRLGISRNILQQRLSRLVDHGLLARVPYQEHPPRHDYRLTDKGRDLWPVINAMRQWGDKYAAPSGPPVRITHHGCGEVTHTLDVCAECGEPVGPRDVKALAGPGRAEPGLVPARRG